MRDLRLAVKREYFEAIERGEKLEEYREAKYFWKNRLLHLPSILPKKFDTVTITLGYPKACDTDKILKFKYKGFKIKEITHKHFGKMPILVFAIDLSERI